MKFQARVSLLKDSVVVVEGSKIKSVGEKGEINIPQGEDIEIIDAKGRTVMPGLIDTHVHLCLDGEAALFKLIAIDYSCVQMVTVGAGRLKKALDMGITTVRDGGSGWGWFECALKDGIARGEIPGPRFFASGYHLTVSGGHGYFLPYHVEKGKFPGMIGMQVDGPDEWRKAARLNIYNGTDAVKIVVSRDLISPGVPIHSQATYEEAKAAFDEAHSRGKWALAHAQGAEAVKKAVKAGATGIVHGFWIDDEAAEMMVKNDVNWEATNLYAKLIHDFAEGTLPDYMDKENIGGLPEFMWKPGVEGWKWKMENFKKYVDGGVKFTFGSDAGVPYVRHGYNAMELSAFVELGISPMDAILSATKNAAQVLDIADEVGTVMAGKYADIIMVEGDPLKDISVLHTADKIKLVMQNGNIVKTREPIKTKYQYA